MAQDLGGKYWIKRQESDSWTDVNVGFNGLNILSITGFNEYGDAVNVYNEQWLDGNKEDYLVTSKDTNNNDMIIRKNQDLTLTFIAGTRYSTNKNIDTQSIYNAFVDFICNHGAFYIKSAYNGFSANVVCLKGVKPTSEKLHRGLNSYILATATLHCLDKPIST